MAEERKGQIYLVRHGEASYTSSDYDKLSSMGLKQARALGSWFANQGEHFSKVVTGNLRRHKETAEECMAVLPDLLKKDIEWQIDEGFNEFIALDILTHYRPELGGPGALGAYLAEHENPALEFNKVYFGAIRKWVENQGEIEYRESWLSYKKRTSDALKRVIENAGSDQNVIVFTSAGTIGTICLEFLPNPTSSIYEVITSIANCGVTKLIFSQGKINLAYFNHTAYLDVANL